MAVVAAGILVRGALAVALIVLVVVKQHNSVAAAILALELLFSPQIDLIAMHALEFLKFGLLLRVRACNCILQQLETAFQHFIGFLAFQ